MSHHVSRRTFMATAAAVLAAADAAKAEPANMKGPLVCVFSKHVQFLDYAALGKTCKALGLDGVDLTVRKGGHVLPENVASDLPRAADAIRSQGIELAMITTNLNSGSDPDARPILDAASKVGVPYCRVGGITYSGKENPLDELPKFTEDLRSLAKIAEDNHVTLGYHNHSGRNNVGAALWDLERILESVNSPSLGSNFDAGHAAVEGAFGVWEIDARMMAPRVKMMAVKDFVWAKDKPEWVPLGQGVVKTAACLRIMRGAGFAGPISMHFEHKIQSNDAMLDAVREAAVTLRAALKEAGYA